MISNRYIRVANMPLSALVAALGSIGRVLDIQEFAIFERDGIICVEIRDAMESWRADSLLSIVYNMLTGDLKEREE